MRRIIIGADHRGFQLKQQIVQWLDARGYEIADLGAHSYMPSDDYVDYGVQVSRTVLEFLPDEKEERMGIVICGSGVGICVAANKINGIRCGLGFNPDQVHAARSDDNINVLALPTDFITPELALEIVQTFLNTEFSSEDRHKRRLEKIRSLEGRL